MTQATRPTPELANLCRQQPRAVYSLSFLPILVVAAGDRYLATESLLPQGQMADFAAGPLSALNLVAVLASVAIGFIAWQAWSSRPRVANAVESISTSPPEDLHPAYAGALASANINDALMEATVLELACRGAVRIEPDPEDSGDVQIRLLDTSHARTGFETELLRLLERRSREGVVGYRDLNRLRGEWGTARRQLRLELEERGWFDPRARQRKLPFVVTGIIGLSLAGASILAAIVAGNGWPVLGALIVGITSVVVLGMGNIYPSTTAEGEREAVKWRGFRAGLARARMTAHGSIDLDDAFPHIVAFNMAASYNRYLRRASQSGYAPAWFGPNTDVSTWPDGWHDYWISLHTALAPTDSANTRSPGGSIFQRYFTGGRP